METLIAGSVSYFTPEIIKRIFGQDHVVVVSGEDLERRSEKRITYLTASCQDNRYEQIFHTYHFDRVLFLSRFLTFHGDPNAEMEDLRRTLQLCQRIQASQVVYLTPVEVCSDTRNGKVVLLESAERLCGYYAKENWVPVKVIRSPYLCSGSDGQDYFDRLFHRLDDGEEIVIREKPEQEAYFLSMEDLGEFLFRLFDDWDGKAETLSLFGVPGSTFGDLAGKLKELRPEAKITFRGDVPIYHLNLGENLARRRYGWLAKYDVIGNLEELYQSYDRKYHRRQSTLVRLREKIFGLKKWMIVPELVLGCLFVEWLNHVMGVTIQFRMIDIRLLFIVLMGSIYGINAGIAAAVLETIAVGLAYRESGINWQTLFYETSNWVPFILYFTVGAICGYVKQRSQDEQQFMRREYQLAQDKFHFISTLYESVLEDKTEYKRQIIGSRDSFGKIFEVVQQLDAVVPKQIYAEAIPVLEGILSNRSIAIYSIRGRQSAFGRLEVASHPIHDTLQKSIRMEEYAEALEVLRRGEVWCNTDFLDNYPMYMAGIMEHSNLVLLVMVYRVEYTQMGVYYANLLRIVCGLIQSSMLRAWEYQEAVREKTYIGDTMIVKEEYFLELLDVQHTMSENGIARYALIQIKRDGRNNEEIDRLLQNKIRENDVLGAAMDGNLYLILTQIDDPFIAPVLERLRGLGLQCSQVTQIGEV